MTKEETPPIKSYRTDAGINQIGKQMFQGLFGGGGTNVQWAITAHPTQGYYQLICVENDKKFQGWIFTREELSNMWEMLSEVLHHD